MTDVQQTKPKRVMMMAAGTGGHVFPALAVAKQLQQQGTQVSWLATPTGMENRLLKNQNIQFIKLIFKAYVAMVWYASYWHLLKF